MKRAARRWGKLRLTAQEKLSKEVVKALRDFSKENDGRVPTDLSQLKSYVTSAAGAVLDTYDIAKPGWVHPPQPNAPQSENAKTWAIVMKGSFYC